MNSKICSNSSKQQNPCQTKYGSKNNYLKSLPNGFLKSIHTKVFRDKQLFKEKKKQVTCRYFIVNVISSIRKPVYVIQLDLFCLKILDIIFLIYLEKYIRKSAPSEYTGKFKTRLQKSYIPIMLMKTREQAIFLPSH